MLLAGLVCDERETDKHSLSLSHPRPNISSPTTSKPDVRTIAHSIYIHIGPYNIVLSRGQTMYKRDGEWTHHYAYFLKELFSTIKRNLVYLCS